MTNGSGIEIEIRDTLDAEFDGSVKNGHTGQGSAYLSACELEHTNTTVHGPKLKHFNLFQSGIV